MESNGRTLTIIASPDARGTADVRWCVTVKLGETIAAENLQLVNPYNEYEAAECKWYLEAYAPKSPYETRRAQKAAEDIDRYGKSLIKQLGLNELVQDGAEVLQEGKGAIEIIIVEENPAVSTASIGATGVHSFYWESLESVELWGLKAPPAAFNVRRRFLRQTVQDQTFESKPAIPGEVFSILLVTARDCTVSYTKDQDIDPFLITSILLDLQEIVSQSGRPRTIDLEVVRPGTFSAFERALNPKFDAVHFDLHGKVVRKQQKAVACLQFAAENSPGQLLSVSAERVAGPLQRNKISIVTLNSCRSAQNGRGDEANLAKALINAGIQNVVAMSMSISQTAASIFVRSLYVHFIFGGSSLSRSVAAARESLRRQPQRLTRYGAHVDVNDWLVPTLYTSAVDTQSWPSQLTDDTPSHDFHAIWKDQIERSSANLDLPHGRHFDILRLERHATERKVTLLTGCAGVGKTAVLNALKKLWGATHWVDTVLYVDLGIKQVESMAQFAAEIMSDFKIPSVNDLSSSQALTDAIFSRRCALILDGLHNSHSSLPENCVPTKMSEATRNDFNKFLLEIVSRKASAKEYDPLIILAGREDSISWWNVKLQPIVFEPEAIFHLEDLEMMYAITLARKLCKRQQPATIQASIVETENAEILVRLLQGNPLSMHVVCPSIDLGERSHLGALLFDQVPGLFPTLRNMEIKFVADLRRVSEVAVPEISLMWRSLCLFWHEGPFKEHWESTISELVGAELAESLEFALQCGTDRGLLTWTESRIDWIHPLFTIYARHCFPRLPDDEDAPEEVKSGPFWTLMREYLRPMKEAVLLREKTMDAIEYSMVVFARVDREAGTRFETTCNRFKAAIFNMSTCISACTELYATRMPLTKCPLGAIGHYTQFSRQILLRSELFYLDELFISVIDRLESEFDDFAIPPQYQLLAFQTLNHLICVHNGEMGRPFLDCFELSNQCVKLIEASETTFGPHKSSIVLWHKSLCFKYRAFLLLKQMRIAEADAAWSTMLEIDRVIFNEADSASSQDISANSLKWEDGEDKSAYAQPEVRKAWRQLKHKVWQDMKRSIATVQSSNISSEEALPDVLDFTESSRALLGVTDAVTKSGVEGFSTDRRWWPARHDLNQYFASFEDRDKRLEALEKARDNGSWMEAAKHHLWLAEKAAKDADIDVALHHFTECLSIRKELDSGDEELRSIAHRIEQLEKLQKLFRLGEAADGDAIVGNHKKALSYHDEALRQLESLDLGSDEKSVQVWKVLKAHRTHLEFMANAQSSILGNHGQDVDQGERERRQRNYEVVYTAVGREIGFIEREAMTVEYNKRMRQFLESSSSGNVVDMIQNLDSLIEMRSEPLFIALKALPEWSSSFKDQDRGRSQLVVMRAVIESKWDDAMTLALEALDDLGPDDTGDAVDELRAFCSQTVFQATSELDGIRLKANEDQDWETAIDITQRLVAHSRTDAQREFLTDQLERTQILRYQAELQQAALSLDFAEIRRLQDVGEEVFNSRLRRLSQKAESLGADKPDELQKEIEECSEGITGTALSRLAFAMIELRQEK